MTPPLSPSRLDAWLDAECGGNLAVPLPERLEAARLEALRRTLCRAFSLSRWYKRTLAGCNLDIDTAADLANLPFTTPEDLHDYREFLCVPQGDVQRIVTLQTSGSTNAPKRIAFSEGDLARTASFFAAGMAQLVHEGQRLMVLLPGAQCPDGVTDLLRQALTPSGVDVVAGHPEATAETLRNDLSRWHPQCLVAAPHQLDALLDASRDDTFRRLASCVEGIQSSGDILDLSVRDGLEEALDCVVLDHYGMTETCFGGGVQCMAKNGYHLRELDLFLEILDPVSGKPVPEGETGEIILTTLNREAMPLIRYRTGDAAAWLPGPCPCGSPMRRLSPLKGRYVRIDGAPVLRLVRKGGFYARTAASSVF
ncbi:DVU_1553 family AMP-dependent CoA ligase [uncultured Mailhella sp.]|uniref:DVU_1553 family AMP-dependent CoA ligase n=1 Tax=uncultured Mailhella sp. TaxID=1981031 RepID=UPI0025EFCA1F|nr:AMP-binding protein [uncultured Mailhella sp.]